MGIPASGKSSFFKEKFFLTHMRINLDMLKRRSREEMFIEACLETDQSFVVDNTNPTRRDRERYIAPAKENGFEVIGYYLQSNIDDCLARNAKRLGRELIPEGGVRSVHSKLELPNFYEGFDHLYYVSWNETGFNIEDWQ